MDWKKKKKKKKTSYNIHGTFTTCRYRAAPPRRRGGTYTLPTATPRPTTAPPPCPTPPHPRCPPHPSSSCWSSWQRACDADSKTPSSASSPPGRKLTALYNSARARGAWDARVEGPTDSRGWARKSHSPDGVTGRAARLVLRSPRKKERGTFAMVNRCIRADDERQPGFDENAPVGFVEPTVKPQLPLTAATVTKKKRTTLYLWLFLCSGWR